MNSADLAERADANYFHSWRLICGNAKGGEVVERDGMLLAASGLPVASFNLALVTRKLASPSTAVAEAATFFDDRGLPFIVRVRDGVDEAAELACDDQGLPFSDTVPGLMQAPIGVPPAPMDRLEIRAAGSEAEIGDHRTVMSAAFDFPVAAAERVLGKTLIDVAGCEFYIGYLDGVPVGSSALIASEGTAGIYNVGCAPDVRKQGFGEAMTWHAVRRGRELGCDIASLQTSEMGRPIYERMGFRLVAPYRTFVRRT